MFGFFKAKSKPEAASGGDAVDTLPPVIVEEPSLISAAAQATPGGIPYYPNLIEELVHDHQVMATLKKSIRRAFLRKDLKKTEKRLEEFASVFRSHILKENVRMYAYLQQQFTDEKNNIEIVKYFRKEMNGIARTVLSFLEKYESLQQLSEEQQLTTGVTKDLIRLSLGLEDIEDLKSDLKSVFAKLPVEKLV